MATLRDKIAVVTGGTSGIGLATAKRFATEGATAIVTGRRQAQLDAPVGKIPSATGFQVDSAKIGELAALFERIRMAFGSIDVLFVNAGGGSLKPLGEINEDDFGDVFDRNVKGVLFTVQMALPLLPGGTSIILTGSTAAAKATAGFSSYSASKAAIHAFTRNWMIDLKGRGIRINSLVPGPTETPGLLGLAGTDGQPTGVARPVRARRTDGTRWSPRRNRECCALPGVRRVELRHRLRTLCRWRRGTRLRSLANQY